MSEVSLLLQRYEDWIRTIPIGSEDEQRGSSAYNWHRAALSELKRLSETHFLEVNALSALAAWEIKAHGVTQVIVKRKDVADERLAQYREQDPSATCTPLFYWPKAMISEDVPK